MAEQVSRQAAKVAARTKMSPNEAYGKKRVVVITSPAAVTWAQGDTIASPQLLPVGTRFTCGSQASFQDMGTSITLDVGIRDKDGNAIDADGIAASIDVATAAGRADLNNGALIKDGAEYVTTVPCYVYATLNGGTPSANAQIRIEVEVVTPD
jgi:hypothetical protein